MSGNMGKWQWHFAAVRRAFLFLLGCAILGAASCSGHESGGLDVNGVEPPNVTAGAAEQQPPGALPFDPAAIVANAHLAFRAEGDSWTSSTGPLDVRASLSGFSVEPARVVPGGAGSPTDDAEVERGAALELKTVGAGRGGRVALSGRHGEVGKDGGLAIDRGDLVEHLRSSKEGVEQSFSFGSMPPGPGDLEIEVRVSGQAYYGQTESGHHFFDPSTGLGVRFGLAKWIDANGTTTEVPVRWEDGALILAVAADVVEASAYPAVLDPVVSAEFGMDVPVPSFGVGNQYRPSVTFDGANYLVVWVDELLIGHQIVATRVDQAGVVLDIGGIYLPSSPSPSAPAAVSNGTNTLVTWSQVQAGTCEVRGARISQGGVVLDPLSNLIATCGANIAVTPAMATDGTDFMIVWLQSGNLYTRKVAASGNPVGVTTMIQTGLSSPATIAFDGANYMVTFVKVNQVYCARVSAGGLAIDVVPIAVSNGSAFKFEPKIAYGGSGSYLIAWSDFQLGTYDVIGSRVSTSAVVLDPSGLAIHVGANSQYIEGVAFDGTNYAVIWYETSGGDVYAGRVTTNGALLDSGGFVIGGGPAKFSQRGGLACYSGSCLAAWDDQRNLTVNWTSQDVYGARFSGSTPLDALDGFNVSAKANAQYQSDVAWSGSNYLVVWHDFRNGAYDIYGARVDAQGAVLDPTGIPLSTATADQTNPSVAYAAPNYLVVWQDKRASTSDDVYGTRVGTDGSVLDPGGLLVSATTYAQRNVSVGSSGSAFLVIWPELHGSNYTLYGVRVSAAGAVLDPSPVSIATSTATSQPETAIAYDGTNYLAVMSGGSTIKPIVGALVTPAGVSLNPSGLAIASNARSPSVGFDGTNYLLVYERTTGIYGTRLTAAGAVIEANGFPISTVAGSDGPSLVFDGTTYQVVWRDPSTGVGRLMGSEISVGAVVNPPNGAVISSNGYEHEYPAIATAGGGSSLLVYNRYDYYPPYGASRVHARALAAYFPVGAACTQATDCQSGLCIDGVCCSTFCGPSNGATDTTDCVACSVAAGSAVDGTCAPTTGNLCDDSDACTGTSACQAGTCVGSQPVVCTALDQCHLAGVCDSASGACSMPLVMDGTSCDDGNACTQTDVCQQGTCVGQNAVVCPAAGACNTVAACDTATGVCPVTLLPDNTPCSDGSMCTTSDTCQAGACVPGPSIVCPMPDQCHTLGVCNAATGQCSKPIKVDGTPCDDGDACTQSDACKAGVCAGTAVLCAAVDDCHLDGVCDAATGICSVVVAADSTPCDDGDLCTTSDVCQNGVCQPGNPKTCPASTDCHDVLACDPATGECPLDNQPDGMICGGPCTDGGKCYTGVCKGAKPTECQALDECHVAGVCDDATDTCSNPVAPDGTPCSLGQCLGGTCQGETSTSTSDGATSSASGGVEGEGSAGEDGGGCGCRTSSSEGRPSYAWVTLALMLVLRRRKKVTIS